MQDLLEHNQDDERIALLVHAFNNVDEAIFLADEDAKFVRVNEKACQSLGYTRKELLSMQIFDIDPDFTREHWEEYKDARAVGSPSVTLETRHQTKDGRIFSVEVRVSSIPYQGKNYNMSLVRDISERKAKDKENSLLNHALNHVQEAVWLIGQDAKIHYVNEKACHETGLAREKLLTLTITDVDPDFPSERWSEHWQNLQAKRAITLESSLQTKDGHIFPIEVNANYFEFGGESYNLAFSRDISERKATENRLALLNYALDHVGEAAWLIDENTKFHYNNAEASRAIGYSREELLELGVPDIDPLYQLEVWPEHWQDLKANGSLTFESLHKTKEGRIFPVEINANYFEFDGTGYNLALIRDITERKATEKQLNLLNFALDHVKEAVWLGDENGKIQYVNQEACHSTGYTRDELLQLSVSDVGADFPIESWIIHWQELKASNAIRLEIDHKTKDGHIFPVEVNASYFEFEGQGYNLALSHDITERKQAQEALQRSEELLAEAQHIAHIGSWEVDFTSGQLVWSDETYRIWEINKSQFGATVEAFYDTIHPEDVEKVATAYNESVANKTSYQIEHRLLFPDGRIKYIAERGEPFLDENGNIFRFVGTAMDITEQQRVKETLEFVAQRGWKESGESFLHALAQYLGQLFGVDYIVIDKLGASPTEAETVALYVKGDIVPNMIYDLKGTPCDGVMNGKLCIHAKNVQQLFPDDHLLVEMQVESYAGLPLWNTNGEVIGLIAVMDTKPMNDISFITSIVQLVATSVAAELERQHSEQVLFDAHHFLKQIVNTLADPVFVKDRQHRWILLNQAFCEFIGHSREELSGKSDYDFFPKEQADVFWQKDELVFSSNEENINEENLTDADGNLRTIITKKTCYTDSNGQQFLVGIITDITERKHMENELAAREEQFRVLAETLPSPVCRFDKECRRIYVNPITEKITGIPAKELLYKKASDSSPLNADELKKVEQTIELVLKTGAPQTGDVLFKVPVTEQIYYFHNSYAPEFDAKGEVTSVIVISHDITERKKMEEKLRQREQEFRILVETSPAPIIRYDTNCRRIYVNPAVETMSGKTKEQLLTHTPTQGTLLDKHVTNEVERVLQYVIKTGRATEGEAELVLADGQTRYFYNRYAPELDANGNVISVVLMGHDITELKLIEHQFATREREFRMLAENMPDNLLRYNALGRVCYMNSSMKSSLTQKHLPTMGKTLIESFPNDEKAAQCHRNVKHVIATGENFEHDIALDWNGKKQIHHVRFVPERDRNGEIVGVLSISRDITESKHMEEELAAREQQFRSLAENMPDHLSRYDRQGRVIYMNPALIASLVPEMLPTIGMTIIERFPNDDMAIVSHKTIEHVITTGEEYEVELILPNPLGKMRNHHIRYVAEYDLNGDIIGVIAIGRDITERKRIEQEMHYHASYDTLTGLPNRRMFNNRLRVEILKAERSQIRVALLFIDLDNFKEVNDMLGHETGDHLLVEAAKRIQSCVRETDTVARLGGDEFVAILPEAGLIPPLERIAAAIIDALAKPFQFGEHIIYISGSIGIAVYPNDATDVDALMGCADQAMYAAKELGKNSFNFFTRSMQEQAHERLMLINNLRLAIENEQLHMYYQPIVDVSTGKIVKAEALIRWIHPTLGMISPAVFIPLAEETNLIQEIGTWVFHQAAHTAQQWNLENDDDGHLKISINMSPRQLLKGDGDHMAIEFLQKMNINPNFVVIEITEGVLLDNSALILEKLERLQAAGIELSLDDFGTGYSAIAYLKKFNLDYLKIDRSFVKDLETEESDVAIAEAIVVMAHRLGLKIVAEGVETQGQRDLLETAGCEYIQGYFYAKPMPKGEFLAFTI
ncbi:MAG: PAS domain S-box protein [Methylococcales bacterium]|nr:PAS domain S-box protein [Methylococcales bacterium]